jgi:hypothetical protein
VFLLQELVELLPTLHQSGVSFVPASTSSFRFSGAFGLLLFNVFVFSFHNVSFLRTSHFVRGVEFSFVGAEGASVSVRRFEV